MKPQKRLILLLFAIFVTNRNINSYSVFIITKSRTCLLQSADSVCLHLFCTPFRVRRTKEKYEGRMYDVRRKYEGRMYDVRRKYEGQMYDVRRKYEGRMYDVRRIYEGKEVRRRRTKEGK